MPSSVKGMCPIVVLQPLPDPIISYLIKCGWMQWLSSQSQSVKCCGVNRDGKNVSVDGFQFRPKSPKPHFVFLLNFSPQLLLQIEEEEKMRKKWESKPEDKLMWERKSRMKKESWEKIKNKEIGQKWLKKKQQQCNRNTNNDRKDVGRGKDNRKKEKDSTVK